MSELDRPLIARVLVQAHHTSVKLAAEAHGIDARKIHRWRTLLATDPELMAFYSEALAASDGAWRMQLRIVAAESCKAVVELQRRALAAIKRATDDEGGDPMQQVVMLTEAQAAALRVMSASVEVLVQYEALVDTMTPTPVTALVKPSRAS